MSQSARHIDTDDTTLARLFEATDTDATFPTRVVGRDLTPEACDLTTADLLGLL